MEKENTNPFFHCYSFKLCYFLKSQGFSYVSKDKNNKNNLTFYNFVKSEDLNIAIGKWNNLKDKSKEA